MNKYEDKYYILNTGIIHIKECHYQTVNDTYLIEIDDWCGKLYYLNWTLNNFSILIEIGAPTLSLLKEVSLNEFTDRLQTEIEDSIGQIKQGQGY